MVHKNLRNTRACNFYEFLKESYYYPYMRANIKKGTLTVQNLFNVWHNRQATQLERSRNSEATIMNLDKIYFGVKARFQDDVHW